MLSDNILKKIKKEQDKLLDQKYKEEFRQPDFNPQTYYKDISDSIYFDILISIRHFVKTVSDYYFSNIVEARNVDLFMLTNSVSSPMGPGSDSEPISIILGDQKTHLVDSAQFGLEPLILNKHDKLYCYLPSMRGEDPDERHLNQFYHCEMEMRGTLEDLIPIIEGYVTSLSELFIAFEDVLKRVSTDYSSAINKLKKTRKVSNFPQITFDKVIEELKKEPDSESLLEINKHGCDITAEGENRIFSIFDFDTPVWITNYHRDRVPFYQKPTEDGEKVINADLIFPSATRESFGGEIVGAGQRQDTPSEMHKSLERQSDISPEPYEWYIDLRRHSEYSTTSGFGLGIERFIAWALAKSDIKDVAIYPRLKNTRMNP